MQIGFKGLGKMGANMVHRLRRDGDHAVTAYDPNPQARQSVETYGAGTVASLEDLIPALQPPRGVWIMVPSGKITEETVEQLRTLLDAGDTIIDGGNSNYHGTIARAQRCHEKGIAFVDAGTSGGIWGLQVGYCLMVGGEKATFEHVEPLLKTLAPPDGYLHCGPYGAGHFVKMVHNGIEYGMMQAYGEGFEILKASQYSPDLYKVAHLWNQGSVVRSWLLELGEDAFRKHGSDLSDIRGYVEDS